jgi:hypothetical protein
LVLRAVLFLCLLAASSTIGVLGLTGARPVTSGDDAFSVVVPQGWFATHSLAGKNDLVLGAARPHLFSQVETRMKVLAGPVAPLDEIESLDPGVMAQIGGQDFEFGKRVRTAVDGQPAVAVDVQTGTVVGQLIFVNYRGRGYIIILSSDRGDYDRVRAGEFADMLSSWHWR